MERHVLVVYPHPDDEAFGTGGTIAQYTQAGVPVTLVCGTLGEMGRNMGSPFFANRETLPVIREKELRAACTVLGIDDLRLLGLRDKTVEFEDRSALADRIMAIIGEVNPSLVITHYPEHGVHPDHDAMGRAAVLAVSRLAKQDRPVVIGHAITKHRENVLGPPDVVHDVRGVWDTKLAALRAHQSQTAGMFANAERELETNPDAFDSIKKNFGTEVFWTIPISDI